MTERKRHIFVGHSADQLSRARIRASRQNRMFSDDEERELLGPVVRRELAPVELAREIGCAGSTVWAMLRRQYPKDAAQLQTERALERDRRRRSKKGKRPYHGGEARRRGDHRDTFGPMQPSRGAPICPRCERPFEYGTDMNGLVLEWCPHGCAPSRPINLRR